MLVALTTGGRCPGKACQGRVGWVMYSNQNFVMGRRGQRLLAFLLAVTVSAGAVAGGAEVVGAEIRWPLSHNSADELVLNLPPGYSAPQLYKDAANRGPVARATDLPVEDELVIKALWPNLEPPATHDYALEPRGATMEALVTPRAVQSYRGQPINTLENAFDDAVWMFARSLCGVPVQTGIHPDPYATRCDPSKAADVKPVRYGLQRQGVDFKKHPELPEAAQRDRSLRDIYYLRDDGGSLKTVILCTAEEARTVDDGPQYHVVGQCEHKFIDAKLNALVSVYYRRVYLQNWREVETAWRKLLESFVERRVTDPQH